MSLAVDQAREGPAEARRRRLFLFQDGVVLAATLRGLARLGLLGAGGLPDLPASGLAHLRVGLRTLAQAGWLAEGPGLTAAATRLDWTAEGRAMLAGKAEILTALGDYLATFADPAADVWSRPWTWDQSGAFAALAARGWSPDPHLDGALATPLLLSHLAGGLPLGDLDPAQRGWLAARGWLGGGGDWTPAGRALLDDARMLGLTASYLPLLSRLPELYAGTLDTPPGMVAGMAPDGREWHVQRELNIAASTAAHGRYFADADALVRAVFDAEPLEAQPDLVLDVGCGDGAWLARINRLVREETLRGRHLDRRPLALVGADYAPVAVERARARLATAGVEAVVVLGDVGDPGALAAELAGRGLDMAQALHLHAFVDHDRGYLGAPAGERPAVGSGTYIGPAGEVLSPAAVEADLTAHLARWAPYARRHGLIALEAHGVPPILTARRQGALHSLAFDAYHGYSRQYPVERAAYVEAARRAGLRPAATGGRTYPASLPFTAVSLNHLFGSDAGLPAGPRGPRQDSWTPPADADLADGEALHRLVYADGDPRHPASWCAPATNALVSRAMDILEARLERLAEGETLRVADYGTGTGLAALELLKACRERGFEARLAARGASLELLCLDIPGGWFAKGHDLLKDCGWTRFYALTDAAGRFRPLAQVIGGRRMDVIVSSMVFHLIRRPALDRALAELAGALAPGGVLLWNAPDIGPAGPGTLLFHDANRMLRACWEDRLTGASPPSGAAQRAALAAVARDADGRPRLLAERAGRRILARANTAADLEAALAQVLDGPVVARPHEIAPDEIAQVLRVPSNHREYLPEIAQDALRLAVIDELMTLEVLPAVLRGPAASGLGAAVHWTGGEHRALYRAT